METRSKLSELIDTLSSENVAYLSAVGRNSGVANVKTRLMNILFNNRDLILQQLSNVDVLNAKVQTLTEAMAEADEEYNELNRKYKELLNTAAPAKEKPKSSDQGA